MKINIIKNWASWRYVLSIADRIEHDTEGISADESNLCDYLESIEMALGQKPDPVSDIHEFALMRLCRAVRKSLVRHKQH